MSKERIELNCTTMSGSSSIISARKLLAGLSERNMPAVCVMDESVINAYPELEREWRRGECTTRPLYGTSLRVMDLPGKEKYNVSVIIRNEAGKKNLFRLFTETGFVNGSQVFLMSELMACRDGLLLGMGMYNSKLERLLRNDADDDLIALLLRDYDYVEVLPGDEYEEQNVRVVGLCEELDIPVVAVSRAAYIDEKDKFAWIVMNGVDEECSDIYVRHIRSTKEMLDAFYYLTPEKAMEIVVDNTHLIADMCEDITICDAGKFYPELPDAGEKLAAICNKALVQKYDENKLAKARTVLEFELDALKNTHMETYVLLYKELMEKAGLRACDISLRGVSAGSIVAFLCGISEVDPLVYNLSPEFIFGYDGLREIDIDINVPGDRQKEVQELVASLEGVEHAIHASTFKYIGEAGVNSNIDYFQVVNGVSVSREYSDYLCREMGEKFKGRSKHPGGMIVFPTGCDYKALTPVARLKDGTELSYFEWYNLDRMFIKMDILANESVGKLDRLSRMTGVDLQEIPSICDDVLQFFRPDENGQITGCSDLPEFKSEFVREMVAKLKPETFDDLVKICTLSHGTGTWLDNAEVLISDKTKHITVKDLIGNRDDVFDFLVAKGVDKKLAFDVAENVRKGKVNRGRAGKWPEWKESLIETGIPEWFVWSCEQIQYLFPRAHAVTYMYMTMRLGWFKIHYPEQFAQVMSLNNDENQNQE